MSTYAIGDLQGCVAPLEALLEKIAFDPSTDRVWLVGDLVNRGPESLATLRRVMALGSAATVVLGNHDLHLLAVAAGVRKRGRSDTLDDILAAPDVSALLDWLRARPLAHRERIGDRDLLLVHAGILPTWSADDAMRHAAELEAALRGDDHRSVLAVLFGNEPDRWSNALSGPARLRMIVNVFTRMRFCSDDGRIDFDAKDAPSLAGSHFPPPPAGFAPWFSFDRPRWAGTTAVVGHWSTLGLLVRDDVIALDSGCVWGGALTAVRLEDRAVFQVPCPKARSPG